ncbi:hypothetical protein JD844_013892 [Phrynosoma platyrhinos]|uniref:Uncharacterized protein n=1 Tax=Phrynosoma platyrhinos TaxID=52577 RepID=A0ABQ7TMJ9_PHRPL|nr:hypothetical protein JD844_013892 [Phrynosoma platyrhinos]
MEELNTSSPEGEREADTIWDGRSEEFWKKKMQNVLDERIQAEEKKQEEEQQDSDILKAQEVPSDTSHRLLFKWIKVEDSEGTASLDDLRMPEQCNNSSLLLDEVETVSVETDQLSLFFADSGGWESENGEVPCRAPLERERYTEEEEWNEGKEPKEKGNQLLPSHNADILEMPIHEEKEKDKESNTTDI